MTEQSPHKSADEAVEVEQPVIEQARLALLDIADSADHVGDFVGAWIVDSNVLDMRFVSALKGYEGWQWSITMYHDIQADKWTVNESSLVPTADALLAPEWIPWKDRLLPSDISPTDVLGTEPDDVRLEQGVSGGQASDSFRKTEVEEYTQIVEELNLSRSRVLSAEGRAQTAERWYNGPHGPKSLSTRVAAGKTCQTCGFFVQLQGELGTMFGVCANKWSQDDGRIVSLDHGCGEHSDIDPPEPSQLWIQPEPTVDDGDDIIIVSRPRVAQPTAEERRIADILEDVDNPDDLVDEE
ncbi:DUF3027 domain-containing protein [Alloscardovia omnicolens]|uniref:DUF3027 domain-containing protein n=1 Tax=Alloscardovia omnicolens TaxID=419015 RepID=UPI00405572D9